MDGMREIEMKTFESHRPTTFYSEWSETLGAMIL